MNPGEFVSEKVGGFTTVTCPQGEVTFDVSRIEVVIKSDEGWLRILWRSGTITEHKGEDAGLIWNRIKLCIAGFAAEGRA